ncbi:MAG: AAA family ATPase [Streptomycetaceae bacterium]|nr:AAA family ATPase [Streptomycetaceae bacterium]
MPPTTPNHAKQRRPAAHEHRFDARLTRGPDSTPPPSPPRPQPGRAQSGGVTGSTGVRRLTGQAPAQRAASSPPRITTPAHRPRLAAPAHHRTYRRPASSPPHRRPHHLGPSSIPASPPRPVTTPPITTLDARSAPNIASAHPAARRPLPNPSVADRRVVTRPCQDWRVPPYPGFDTPFVGRRAELADLDEALVRARAGDPRALLVAGEAGVGKTRLLSEAAAQASAAGMTVLTGHCVDLGEVGLPYFPFTEILREVEADERLAPILAGHPPIQRLLRAGSVASGAGADDGPETGVRLRLLDHVTALVAGLAERAPVLLVIEDLHWADQSTRDLLRFLLSRLLPQRSGGAPHQRVAVLASYRSDDLHRRHPLRPLLAELVRLPVVGRLDLGPMADEDVARLVRSLGDEPPSEAAVRHIVEQAEGNAFYAEELRVATADAGAAADALPGVPPGLAEVLLTRIEQLSMTGQRVLRTAAVAGREVEHQLLRDAVELPDDELESVLREAVGRHLLVSDERGRYSFRHALTRDAAYRDLLPGERVRIHGVFARLLEAGGGKPGNAAARAHHHRESHDLPGALTASLEAADHAARVGAPAEELRHVEAALDLWDAVPDAEALAETDDVALMLRASAAAVRMGEAHRAVTLAREALGRLDSHSDTSLAAEVRYTLASSLMTVDNLQSAFEFSSQALALIPAEPPTLTWVWAAATHALAAFYVGDRGTAEVVGRQALDAAGELGAYDAQADVLITLTALQSDNRQTPAGREQLRRARELARRAENPAIEIRALYGLALGSFEAGLLDDSLTLAEEGLERARRTGRLSSPYPLELRYLRALGLYTVGRWDEAVAATGSAPSAFGHVAQAALYVPLGRGEPGVAERAEALFRARPFNWMGTMVGGVVLTDEAALRGDAQAAADWARQAVDALREDGQNPDVGIRLAGLALSAIGDAVAGLRIAGDSAAVEHWVAVADEFVEMARCTEASPKHRLRSPGPEAVAWLLRVEGERARVAGEADVELWEKTVAAYDYGDVYERARAQLRLAQALAASGRRAEAAQVAEGAYTTADRLGAAPLREALSALARRADLVGGPPVPDAAVLTVREREVLEQLALGRTNRQIGEALFISVKTASVHVSNILAKVGAASRTEAVALAYRQGLISRSEESPPDR